MWFLDPEVRHFMFLSSALMLLDRRVLRVAAEELGKPLSNSAVSLSVLSPGTRPLTLLLVQQCR